jgi:tetratricopeptide (TPR) repeat protein
MADSNTPPGEDEKQILARKDDALNPTRRAEVPGHEAEQSSNTADPVEKPETSVKTRSDSPPIPKEPSVQADELPKCETAQENKLEDNDDGINKGQPPQHGDAAGFAVEVEAINPDTVESSQPVDKNPTSASHNYGGEDKDEGVRRDETSAEEDTDPFDSGNRLSRPRTGSHSKRRSSSAESSDDDSSDSKSHLNNDGSNSIHSDDEHEGTNIEVPHATTSTSDMVLSNRDIGQSRDFRRAMMLGQTGSIDDLNRAVDVADMATPQDHLDRAGWLSILEAITLGQTGSIDDLNRAIEVADIAVDAMPQDHPDRAGWSSILGAMMLGQTGLIDDLNRTVEVTDMAVDAMPQDHPDRAGWSSILGAMTLGQTGLIDDLNRAIEVADMAVDAIPQDHPDRAGWLSILGVMLRMQFERTSSINDLNRAIEVADMAVDAAPQDYPDRAGSLGILGAMLGMRFERTGSINDLNRAIEVTDMAVDAAPQDYPDRAGWLSNLGNLLGRRFERTSLINDLNRAINVADMAVDTAPQDYPDRASWLSNLGNLLGIRFNRTDSINDLNRGINVADMAVAAIPQDHPNRAGCLSNLGSLLGMRFERIGSIDDLNRAIDITDMAVAAIPQDYPNRAACLNNLGNWLGRRFERTGSIDDLNRAIDVADMAVVAVPQDHPNRASWLNNLGNWLGMRFERTNLIDDLNRAVDITDMAVAAIPQDHPNRATCLNNLGNWLGRRFERTGSIDDLNRAVNVADMAVAAISQDHPNRVGYLNNLGNWLGKRFERTGSIDDLNRAIDITDMAVAAIPQDHPYRATCLNNLGNWLGRRFEQTGSIDDLNRAVDVADIAVEAVPQDYPDRVSYLSNLGNLLGMRFERTGSIDDLNRAIDVADIAVDTVPQDHPGRATYLNNLGNWLGRRFEHTGSMDDRNYALSSYKDGWRCHTAPPYIRIRLARQAANILTLQLNWEESSQLLQDAVNLLPTVSPRSLQHTDKQHMLADFAGLASMAAATTLNAGKDAYHALRLLELGRGVIAGLLMEMRGDISDLKQGHPNLADEFTSLRDELDAPVDRTTSRISTDNIPSWESQARRRREADQKFSELITRIRGQPGFQNFLLPPTADELMAATDLGTIVVINVSLYRCDALLVKPDRIWELPLPRLRHSDIKEKAMGSPSADVLEWLWQTTASPILDELGFRETPTGEWPHIWWIPTGLMSRLPLHAAGHHYVNSSDTALYRVISSYSPSIKSLVYARQNAMYKSLDDASQKALLVSMRTTPGNSDLNPCDLRFAEEEVKLLDTLLPPSTSRVKVQQPHRGDVLDSLSTCTIFHFAGHGISDPLDPSKSCLLLDDWVKTPLTFENLAELRLYLKSPWLAYLSACSTGANQAANLQDEVIHLVSACQLAGFPHVVGSLWEVDDEYSVDAAREVYMTLRREGWNNEAVALGVHNAANFLRGKTSGISWGDGYAIREEGNPSVWAAYIHVGP